MNPRYAKEFRSLLFPWSICALASIGHLAAHVPNGAIRGALPGLAGFAFYLGCLLMAVLPFGLEFQHRTLSLLLAQPLERSRLWKEKFLIATVAVLALVVVHALMVLVAWRTIPWDDILLFTGFIVTTICSAGFFALSGRSIIGGIVFAGSGLFAAFGLVSGAIYLTYRILGRDPVDPEMNKSPIVITYICAGFVYSALALWLGRRVFVEMEVRDALSSTNLALPEWMTPKKLATVLRCKPTGSLRNLIRKEIGLQKPIFTIATVFVACWTVAFLLLLLEPTQREIYVGVLNGLTGVYMAIITLLAGCVSLGDEKALGIMGWHLTLPISARRQWFVKLLVSAATAVLVGIVLPLLLSFFSCLVLGEAEVGLVALSSKGVDAVWILPVPLAMLVLLGFWCASFLENTVRAALAAIVALIGIGTFAQLGAWVALEYFSGLQTNLVSAILASLQISPDFFEHHEAVIPYSIGPISFIIMIVALAQSLAQFRRARPPRFALLKNGLVLAAITFFGAFWIADLSKALPTARTHFESELGEAWALLPYKNQLKINETRSVSSQELEKTGELTPVTLRWLKGSKISVTRSATSFSRYPPEAFSISVTFPNSQVHAFSYAYSFPRY